MNALVGYTGFVGSNLYEKGSFDACYNSQNIENAFGTEPDLLVFAGLKAEKYLANSNPEKDLERIRTAALNISKIKPKKMVLISSIDVFKRPVEVDENSPIDTEGMDTYGYNRYLLECKVRDMYPDALIVRLPGLFGNKIKKNFIYDLINIIPFMLKEEKFIELSSREPLLNKYYLKQDNGFYQANVSEDKKDELKKVFLGLGFSALNFTDSRSRYQFYDLSNLWDDIVKALDNGIRLWHPATEPVSAGDLYHYVTGHEFVNELDQNPADYDFRTIYNDIFGGRAGYIETAENIKRIIKNFIDGRVNCR